ncbi:DUF2752 domain-containing protein [Mycobacterium uberis]|uniref:DUF2752 domain-containing protein n=1 Tax=Mycobacterium uberis TaxID=2162698 RepID=UPI0031202A63
MLLVGAFSYIGLVDPHNADSVYPLCLFVMVTGWKCPLCGGLRLTYDLLHGNLAVAVNDNVFLLIGIPVLIGWVVLCRRRGQQALPTAAWLMIVVASIVWMVLRNLPGFPLVPTVYSG